MAQNKGRTVERIYPLTPMQEGMLFHKMLDEHSTSYVVQEVISVKSLLHETYLSQALELLGERHPILRTAIVYRKVKKPQQVLLKNRRIEMKLIDISGYSDEEQQEEIRHIKRDDVERGFDLEKDSLLRMTILRIGCGEHKMIWSFHHIIMDGWCLSILCSDFMKYYLALSQGMGQDTLREAIRKETISSSSFEEYIHWLKEQNHEECLDYWRNLLTDYSSVAEIAPSGTAVVTETSVNQLHLELSETLSESIVRLCRQHHVTTNTLFELCWGIVLQRYNNVQDVVFGKVVSGRNAKLKDIDRIIGLFINTIPVRVKIEENDSFESIIPRLYEQAVESGKYDYSPLAEIQRVSGIGGDSLKTLMVFENFYVNPAADDLESLLTIEPEAVREQTNYAMNLMIDHTNIFTMKMMYDPSLYHEQEIGRLLQHMQQLITGMVCNPSLPIQEIEIITPEEQQLIVHHFNDTQSEYPHELTIQQLFRQQAVQNPHAEAVLSPMERLTYAELDRRSDEIMGEMKRKGLQEGRLVGIVTEKSVQMIAGILAILKCGCGYVPLDENYPDSRLRFMLEDCGLELLLCGTGNLSRLEQIQGKCHVIDFYGKYEPGVGGSSITSDDIAYVIYTSGSTGQAKGVAVRHRNVTRLVKNTNYVDLKGARILQTGSLSFDAATFEIWGALLNGGALCLVETDVLTEPERLIGVIEKYDLNMMWMTAQLFNNLIDMNPHCFDGLKTLLIGGEKLSEKHVDKLLGNNHHLQLINGYGPTENTTFSLCFTIDKPYKQIPIGRPISNSTAYIMNGTTLCGIGMTGELCLGGDGVAKGYLNREALTLEKFAPDPFNAGQVMYKTGDLARWLPDGNIEYLGRMDGQVKIRGHRIEPGEIESVLRKQAGISDAAVVTRLDPAGEALLCAYIVNSGPVMVNSIDMKRQLRQELPEYMIPSHMMTLDRLPVTSNGKLDR
ncbi:MAG: amino acid adenylation domain-containing protein, partial [Gorillibacterium sp.]|nr:amino acid adenylation domain-containing protein [Gorillibacterium sp.]